VSAEPICGLNDLKTLKFPKRLTPILPAFFIKR
jgi:hypothetical protein